MDNKLPYEFFEWLDSCPVQWFRDSVSPESSTYTFMVPTDNEEEE